MRLESQSIADNSLIAEEFCFGIPAPEGHVQLGRNHNPDLRFAEIPAQARSLVLICVDPDVPSKPDDVNQEGRSVPASLPRCDFYHWVMVDIPVSTQGIAAGAACSGITPRGKREPAGPKGARQGLNDYTNWFAGDPDMGGNYFGYDGPCPPWNDELMHHYQFVLYATDLERCPVDGAFTGQDVMQALEGHILATASITGLYSLNPALARK
jgi:Raf kinase inhibitor-like YbhB/YbcL family protein